MADTLGSFGGIQNLLVGKKKSIDAPYFTNPCSTARTFLIDGDVACLANLTPSGDGRDVVTSHNGWICACFINLPLREHASSG